MSRISITEISQRLRHQTLESTELWCGNNHVEIHIDKTTGREFVYSFQYESVMMKRRFEALKKFYGEETWEKEWQNAMIESMKQNTLPIILN